MSKQNLASNRHWQEMADTEPERIDAFLGTLRLQSAIGTVKEKFGLAVLICEGMKQASDLRAMRASRLRQNMNLPTTRKGE